MRQGYGIVLDFSKAGSLEMVQEDTQDMDFLWPSSQVALEIFKESQHNRLVKAEIIFNSPIAIYSWDFVADALIKEGIVSQKDNTYYIVDMVKLTDLIMDHTQWKDIGVDLYGRISIQTTDPIKSNSGNMFYGLLANILNGGNVVSTEQELAAVLPKLKNIYDLSGYMESSSSDLFEQYLKMGPGSKPLVAGYESQLIEFSKENPEIWENVKSRIVVLYPIPTVWSSHPFISLNNGANMVIEALRDKRLQEIAWKDHGFRTGVAGSQIEDNLGLNIPATLDQIVEMPKSRIMIKLMDELSK